MDRSDQLLILVILFILSLVFFDLLVHVLEIGLAASLVMRRIHAFAIFLICAGINLLSLNCCYFKQSKNLIGV